MLRNHIAIQRVLLVILGSLLTSSPASAQHLIDIAIGQTEGRIGTGVFEVRANGVVPVLSQRVFIASFGDFPNFTSSPGLDSLAGAFEGNSKIGFNILRALRKWNGSAFPSGTEGIPPEQIQIKLGPVVNTAVTPTADTVVTGFGLSVSNGGNNIGEFHHHPGFTLLGDASDGLYLLELELWSTQPGLANSLPYWMVFSQNVGDDDLKAAASWVRANLWQPTCAADLNSDGVVDDADFVIFAVAYDNLVCDPPGCPYDLNGDWVVDDSDFVLFAQAYNDLLCP